MRTALTLLRVARAFADDAETFTAGTVARDALGRPIAPLDPDAAAWDAHGLIYRAAGRTWGGDVDDARRTLDDASRHLFGARAHLVNDGIVKPPGLSPREAMAAAFDLAISYRENELCAAA